MHQDSKKYCGSSSDVKACGDRKGYSTVTFTKDDYRTRQSQGAAEGFSFFFTRAYFNTKIT